MTEKPYCVIVTGRPGSGKTTLAGKLCKKLWMPKLSRDEFKEGYVNTFGRKHDQLPPETNGVVNQVFFSAVRTALQGNVSIVIEAAFQQKQWDHVVPDILKLARTSIIVCDSGDELAARRHLERGLADDNREYYHGDKRVTIYKETGEFTPGAPYVPPVYDAPTLTVSTVEEYEPGLDEIVTFTKEGIAI